VNEQVPPAPGRMLGTGTCVALIAIGAILRFALSTGSPHGLNVHVVGVIVIGAGVLGLLLSLLVWGPLNPASRPSGRSTRSPTRSAAISRGLHRSPC
jgi:hypothetical protein